MNYTREYNKFVDTYSPMLKDRSTLSSKKAEHLYTKKMIKFHAEMIEYIKQVSEEFKPKSDISHLNQSNYFEIRF